MGYRPLSRNEEPLRLRRLRPASKSSALPLALAFCASMSTACASEAILSTDHLPVRRVIVYRNGVAYFERGGHVEGGEVRFKMKESEVGDFLATLAVMENGGSSVRAAAFPLDREAPASSEAMAEEPGGGAKRRRRLADAAGRGRRGRPEEGAADGRPLARREGARPAGRLRRGVAGMAPVLPARRPSRTERQISRRGGSCRTCPARTGRTCTSRSSPAPRSRSRRSLGTSVIPTRPTVTDNGEVVAVVPARRPSLNQAPEPPPPPAPPSRAAPEDGRAT